VYVARRNAIAGTEMKFAKACIALAAIIGSGSLSGLATPQQPTQSEIGSPDRFQPK
jgi:hypothetical protein